MEKIKWRYYLIPLMIWPLLFAISCQKEEIQEKEEEVTTKDYVDVLIDTDQQGKDARRVKDIVNIQSALELYFLDYEYYPQNLDELVKEGYLPNIPKDPESDEYEYKYTPIGVEPVNYYDLSFYQEQGLNDYKHGENMVNP